MEQDLPLRDIHLPDPVGWWPPAPGWWVLVCASIALLASGIWLWRRWRRLTVKALALRELDRIEREAGDPQERLRRLAILLRRTCLSLYPRENVAGLTGEAWLAFLERASGDGRFSGETGRLLVEAPYRPSVEGDPESLLQAIREWLSRLPANGLTGHS